MNFFSSFSHRSFSLSHTHIRNRLLVFLFWYTCHSSDDGYYNLQKNNGASSGGGGSGGGGNIVNSEGYSYVDEVPSLQSTQHRQQQQQSQQKSMSSSHRDQQAQNRARRAQRRVTHNEKRYHSGKWTPRSQSKSITKKASNNQIQIEQIRFFSVCLFSMRPNKTKSRSD